MGLKISNILEKKGMGFEELKNKSFAIDFSNAAYQFLTSIRQRDGTPLMDSNGNITSHLQGIITRSTNLISQGIRVGYIMDGPPPKLKLKTQEQRHESKITAEEKFHEAKENGDTELMLKYSRRFTRLTKEMSEESKQLIEALGMPVIKAPCEADSQIAHCCKNGDVWAAASSDLDLLLHGCPRQITNLTLSQSKKTSTGATIKVMPELVELNSTLKNLGVNRDQLISLGVLIGTDYNQGIHRIGQKKALKIVKELKTPEKIFEKYKIEDVDWKEVMDTFKNMEVSKNYSWQWTKPNVEKVLKIMVDKHEFSETRVMSSINKMLGTKTKVKAGQKGLNSWM
jgi:flap endonuclease-1